MKQAETESRFPRTPAVAVEGVGIRFLLPEEADRPGRKGRGSRGFFRKPPKKEFWALRDVSFKLSRGEILGIIGGNGTGKSTLLKIIAGIFPPTEGSTECRGVVAPLLELGAAFNPELTGYENIFLTGSIYRIPRKTIQASVDGIVEFSGLRRFIHVPVKNYSSGMFMRLAFSLIIFFRPDIVLIDEVFAVGDEVFQQKSFQRILSFRKEGAAIILVTHDLDLITRICDRVLVLSGGRGSFLGGPEEGVRHYRQLLKEGTSLDAPRKEPLPVSDSNRWGTKEVEILSVNFVDGEGREVREFTSGGPFEVRIRFRSRLKEGRPVFGVSLSTIYKLLIYGPNTLEADWPQRTPSSGVVRFTIPNLPLLEGDYLFSAAVYDETLAQAYDHHEHMYHFRVLPQAGREFGSVRIQSHWMLDSD
jgi:ABC-type polysaccharide/polyol phosphate transport system ATPase subunit